MSQARETLEDAAMASSHARLTLMKVLGPTIMVSRSMLGVRVGIPARLMSVTYDRPIIVRLNDAKTRPIVAQVRANSFLVISTRVI